MPYGACEQALHEPAVLIEMVVAIGNWTVFSQLLQSCASARAGCDAVAAGREGAACGKLITDAATANRWRRWCMARWSADDSNLRATRMLALTRALFLQEFFRGNRECLFVRHFKSLVQHAPHA